MARPRKNAPPPPPTQSVHLRLPLDIVEALGKLADKKKQSRNQVMVTLLAKAIAPRAKKETK